MNKIIATFILSIIMTTSNANDSAIPNGLITVKSQHSATETANKFAKLIEDKGLTLFSRINHANNAKMAGLSLPSSEVILFGNPLVGTKLMQCAPTVAIDLPQKALIWDSNEGDTFITVNDPMFLKQQHSIEGCDDVLTKVSGLLKTLSEAAAR